MRKFILSFLALALSTLFPALAVGETYYLILLKSGGRLSTPHHWVEGSQKYFFYLGGTVGIEENLIDRIEKYEREINYYPDTTSENRGKKEPPPTPSQMAVSAGTEKSRETEKSPAIKEGTEKLDIEAYKQKKDQMTGELDDLMEKRRQATARGDNEAKRKLSEEIIKHSGKIYGLTDEVTRRNKGKLPEGWWER